MNIYGSTEWVRIATAGIVSPKERAAAKQELQDHIDDHADTLMTGGLPRSQARERACAAMGDPYEVGRLLRKAHQPYLTRLLQVCRRAAILLAIVTVCSTFLFSSWWPPLGWLTDLFPTRPAEEPVFQTDPLPDHVTWRMIAYPKNSVKAGDYTVSVRRVSVSYHENDPKSGWFVYLELEFRPDWFWQKKALPAYSFTLRGEGSWESTSTCFDAEFDLPTTQQPLTVNMGNGLVTMGGFLNAQPLHLEVEYWGPQNRFTLPIDLTGGVVYEK